MRFSLQWIREYVDPGLPPEQVGDRLTAIGIPMDSMERRGDDTLFDFDVVTNRPDCMSHLGLARELAAATSRPLQDPPCDVKEAGGGADRAASVAVEAEDLCGRYTARVITGVRVGPSPDWLSSRLAAIGLRPINVVVDATNYVLWEMGHPLHAFDLDRLEEKRIVVRRARPSEPITTLDGIARKLTPEDLVIADGTRPVAIAGVMGGRESEISDRTTNVLLESAHFSPASVRRTSKRQGLHTDASHRFERGADIEVTLRAADRCARILSEVAGGRVCAGALDRRKTPASRREIPLRPDRAQRLLGLDVPIGEMKGILTRLGCRVDDGDPRLWKVFPPSFRGDLGIEEDLIEEVARHHGYDRIPTTLPRVFVFPEGRPEPERRSRRVREAMIRSGFTEALNLSLVAAAGNEALGEGGPGWKVLNPLVEGEDRLRASLLPGLLRNLAHNLDHGVAEVRLFEVGNVFAPAPATGDPPDEEERLGMVCGGRGGPKHWSQPLRPPDLFDLKGALESAARLSGLPAPEWRPAIREFLSPGTGSEIRLLGERIGIAGGLSGSLAAGRGVEGPCFVAEISLRRLFALIRPGESSRHEPLGRTPGASRDLSILVDENRSYAEVEEAIRSVEGAPIERISLFDRYSGKQVPAGKVSMAVNLVFRRDDRTLVSEEVSEILDRIVQRLRERLDVVLRGD